MQRPQSQQQPSTAAKTSSRISVATPAATTSTKAKAPFTAHNPVSNMVKNMGVLGSEKKLDEKKVSGNVGEKGRQRPSITKKDGHQPRQSSANRTSVNKISKKASPTKQMKRQESGFNQFSSNDHNQSPHLSRIIRNNDISNELALSQDITFDQEILDQHKSRAARTIQRWYKSIRERRLEEEAEHALQQARQLAAMRRKQLQMQNIERASCDDPYAIVWGNGLFKTRDQEEESQKENFSLFSQQVTAKPVTTAYAYEKEQHSLQKSVYDPLPQEKAKSQQQVQILDQSEDDLEQSTNKLQSLNEMLLKNRDFDIKLEDEEDYVSFLKKLQEKRTYGSPQKSTTSSRQEKYTPPKQKASPQKKYQSDQRESPFQAETSNIVAQNESMEKQVSKKAVKFADDQQLAMEICEQINKVIQDSPQSQFSQQQHKINQQQQQQKFVEKLVESKEGGGDKFQEIMKFLDNAEKDDDIISQNSRYSKQSSVKPTGFPKLNPAKYTFEDDDDEDLTSLRSKQSIKDPKIKEKLLELELEREEKQKTIQLLKQMREEEAVKATQQLEKLKQEGSKTVEEIETQMKDVVEQKLATIKQLLGEKATLIDKLELMQKQIDQNAVNLERVKNEQAEKFKRDIKKEKDAWIASERVRKEKWEGDQIQQIKQTTIQSLEPTIKKLLDDKKSELEKQRLEHQKEIKRERELLSEEWERKVEAARQKALSEKEDGLEKEREKSQQKIHDQYERLEKQFDEERKRWKEAAAQEYDRLENLRRRDKEQLEDQMRLLRDRLEKDGDRDRSKLEDRLEEMQRRHQVELKQAREQTQIQQEEWRKDFLEKQQEKNKEYLKRVHEEMTKEKNQAIQAIIEKLGNETYDQGKLFEKQAESRVKEAEAKSKSDIAEYKALVQQWKEKFQMEQVSKQKLDENLSTLMKRFYDMELEVTTLKEQLREAEKDRTDLRGKLAAVNQHQASLREDLEEEHMEKLRGKDRELKKMRELIEIQEQQHKEAMERAKAIEQKNIDTLEEKVFETLQKKKEIIVQLQEELQQKETMVNKLRSMLDKQRRELLKN